MLTRSHAHLSRVVTLRCPAAILPRVDYHVLRYPRRSGWPRRTLDELLFQSSTRIVRTSFERMFIPSRWPSSTRPSLLLLPVPLLQHTLSHHPRRAAQFLSHRSRHAIDASHAAHSSLANTIRSREVPRFARAAPRGAVLCPRRRCQQARRLPALKVTTRALGSKLQRGDFNDQTRGERTVTTL